MSQNTTNWSPDSKSQHSKYWLWFPQFGNAVSSEEQDLDGAELWQTKNTIFTFIPSLWHQHSCSSSTVKPKNLVRIAQVKLDSYKNERIKFRGSDSYFLVFHQWVNSMITLIIFTNVNRWEMLLLESDHQSRSTCFWQIWSYPLYRHAIVEIYCDINIKQSKSRQFDTRNSTQDGY